VTGKFRLDGRVAVVTGGGRGIGLAIAEAFVAAGARTVIAEINPGLGQAAAERLGSAAEFVALDVARSADVKWVADDLVVRHGRVDVLVNNAGICLTADALDTSDDIWRRQLAVNLDGVFFCCREFGRHMVAARQGSIVNVSSIAGVIDVRPQNHVAYDASKAALTNMSFYLAEELRPSNIAVNVVFPAGTRTTGSDEMVAGREQLGMHVAPLARPEHVVPLVLHLAAQTGNGETGQAFDAIQWNARHGFGTVEEWRA